MIRNDKRRMRDSYRKDRCWVVLIEFSVVISQVRLPTRLIENAQPVTPARRCNECIYIVCIFATVLLYIYRSNVLTLTSDIDLCFEHPTVYILSYIILCKQKISWLSIHIWTIYGIIHDLYINYIWDHLRLIYDHI